MFTNAVDGEVRGGFFGINAKRESIDGFGFNPSGANTAKKEDV
jgi:hypothetical protein